MECVNKEKILEIINNNMNENIPRSNDFNYDLEAAGLESIDFIRIVVALEETFGCEIPDEKLILGEMNTVEKIYELIVTLLSDEIFVDQ